MALKHNTILHCYVLMPNHYHLLLETPEANLSRAMHYLNTAYVNWFKQKYQLVGPILQGRFKAKIIEKEEYFCNASAYIHLNPVRGALARAPEDYPWSSYACHIGKKTFPPWLSNELIVGEFSGDIDDYKCFMAESYLKDKDLAYEVLFYKQGVIIGNDEFKDTIKAKLAHKISEEAKQELPDVHMLNRLSINDVKAIVLDVLKITEEAIFLKKKNNVYKKLAIYAFHKHTDATLKHIGKLFLLKYSTIAWTIKNIRQVACYNAQISALLNAIDRAVAKRRCRVLD
jgi:REP-associated tyrosine transposase